MPQFDSMVVVQVGDVSIQGHQTTFERAELQSRGKPEEVLLGNRVLLPSGAGLKARDLKLEGIVYASHGRSRSQMVNHIESLADMTVDVIGCELLPGGFDSPAGNGFHPGVTDGVLWLHTLGHVAEVTAKAENDSIEFKMEVTIAPHWHPLSPAEWFTVHRQEASPQYYQKASFEVDDINPLPSAQTFFQDEQPYSFHKRFYVDESYHLDPTYFVALAENQDDDLPVVRYASDWQKTNSQLHYVTVDKLRWSDDPVSVYLFKNLTGETDVTIEVTHDSGMWRRATTTTSFSVSDISTAMTGAGYTLVDSDILVIGHITGSATIMRNNARLLNVADLVTRTGGDVPGQIYRGDNVIKVRGAWYAQHHIFRRF